MKKILPILMLAILMASSVQAAFAASVTVAVKQVNPDGMAQTVTCAAMQKGCSVALPLNAGTSLAQSLNIHVAYMSGKIVLSFQTGNGYFYASDTGIKNGFYNALWSKPVSGSNVAIYNVTLVQPQVQYIFAPILSIAQETSKNIAHPPVANLGITVTATP